MKIAGKELRSGREAFIVAEIGINHGGSVSRAIEIIDQLHASGASFDAVKLQYYRTERLCSSAVPEETRRVLKACELSAEGVVEILAYAMVFGYAGIVTVFNRDDFADLNYQGIGIDAWKIASPDAVNEELIRHVAAFGHKPIIVSTGTCDATETDALAALLKEVAPGRHAMLECVSEYPSILEPEVITWMVLTYPDAVVGYSDHTRDMVMGCTAASYGARIIEAHVMHEDGVGVDADVSWTPKYFAAYCGHVRDVQDVSFDPKTRTRGEDGIRASARQSVTLRRDVDEGETIRSDDIAIKRPGTGIPAKDWRSVMGAKAARPIKADVPLTWDDIACDKPATVAASPRS